MDGRKYYVSCPYCGRKMMKVMPGSDLETECGKCNRMVSVSVQKEGFILVGYTDPQAK